MLLLVGQMLLLLLLLSSPVLLSGLLLLLGVLLQQAVQGVRPLRLRQLLQACALLRRQPRKQLLQQEMPRVVRLHSRLAGALLFQPLPQRLQRSRLLLRRHADKRGALVCRQLRKQLLWILELGLIPGLPHTIELL